jgi:hypothetical protein
MTQSENEVSVQVNLQVTPELMMSRLKTDFHVFQANGSSVHEAMRGGPAGPLCSGF